MSLHAQPRIPAGARLVGKLAAGRVRTEPETQNLKRSILAYFKSFGKTLNIIFLSSLFREWLFSNDPLNNFRASVDIVYYLINTQYDRFLEALPPSRVLEVAEKTAGNLGFRELDQKGREERSQKQAFTERVVMAMFGGAALIGPMLIMTLHPSRNTSLITVSVATFVFALALAFIARDSAGKDVLGATAAYAAVLVVFVGTSMAPTS